MFARRSNRLAARVREGLDLVVEFATLGEYRLPEARGAGTATARRHERSSRPGAYRSQLRPDRLERPLRRERCDARRRTASASSGYLSR
jgi:hypothetical protein